MKFADRKLQQQLGKLQYKILQYFKDNLKIVILMKNMTGEQIIEAAMAHYNSTMLTARKVSTHSSSGRLNKISYDYLRYKFSNYKKKIAVRLFFSIF